MILCIKSQFHQVRPSLTDYICLELSRSAYPRVVCTLVGNHRCTGSKSPRTIDLDCLNMKMKTVQFFKTLGTTHPMPQSQVLRDVQPTAKVIKSTQAQKLCITIPYPSSNMEVTFLKTTTVGLIMVGVHWSTDGIHNCAPTYQSLSCMFFYYTQIQNTVT
jgi:hypothetical protein